MIDPKAVSGSIDEVVESLRRAMPSGLTQELEKNFRAVLTTGLAKLDLVTVQSRNPISSSGEKTLDRLKLIISFWTTSLLKKKFDWRLKFL